MRELRRALESDNAILMAEKAQWLGQLKDENEQLQELFEDARSAKDVMVRELNAVDKERHELAKTLWVRSENPLRFAVLASQLYKELEAKHKIYKLREALKKLGESFDAIYIDTAPALNFYTRSALIAAQRCLIPFDCDDFSRQALYNILNEIRDLQEDHNEDLVVEGIVANQFQPRASLPKQLVRELTEEGLPVLPVRLSSSVKMKESHQSRQPLIHMAPKHPLTRQYEDLFRVLHGETVELEPLND